MIQRGPRATLRLGASESHMRFKPSGQDDLRLNMNVTPLEGFDRQPSPLRLDEILTAATATLGAISSRFFPVILVRGTDR